MSKLALESCHLETPTRYILASRVYEIFDDFFSRNFFNEFVIRICIIFNSLRPFLREEFRETNLSNLHLILILITFVCLGNFECSSEYELVSMKFHTFICLSSVTIYLWPW